MTPRQAIRVTAGGALRRILGRTQFRPAFQALHRLALVGLNVGADAVAGSGERAVLRTVARRAAGRPPLIVDVGANIGGYARAVLDECGPGVRLHCLEPSPTAFARLRLAVGDAPGVRLHNIGLDRISGEIDLHAPEAGSPLASAYRRHLDHVGLQMTVTERVRACRLDEFAAAEGIDRIDLLKIDVEGHELAVLEGAGELLQGGAIGRIQFEFGGADIDSRSYLRDFFELLTPRYSIHRIQQNGLAPMARYREADEIFLTTNYVALWEGPTAR